MFLERYINFLTFEKRYSQHTITAYTTDLNQFFNFLETLNFSVKEVKHFQLRAWMVSLIDQKITPKSINRKISVIKGYFKFLNSEGILNTNPAVLLNTPKIPKKLPIYIQEQKIQTLLNQEEITDSKINNTFKTLRDKLIVDLLFSTGIRLAELLSLREADVDAYQSCIKVLGKRSKERIIPITKVLLNAINTYLLQKRVQKFNNKSEFLIVTDKGNQAYSKMIYRIVHQQLSKISTHEKRSPHILRHSFATSLLNNGADINAIKELLGHANLSATQIYTHNSIEKLKSIYKQAHPKA